MPTDIVTVAVPAKIENLVDLLDAEQGRIPADQVRFVEVDDALVDTGATMLSIPSRPIRQLGLKYVRTGRARTPTGISEFDVYGIVRLTIPGRECRVEISELPDDCPVLIGQIPLEMMDWVVDPIGQRFTGNPEHDGDEMIDMF